MELQLVVIPVGSSYEDRGMRNDQHDTVAAILKIPICPLDIGAPQPDVQPITAAGLDAAGSQSAAQPAAGSGIDIIHVMPTVILADATGSACGIMWARASRAGLTSVLLILMKSHHRRQKKIPSLPSKKDLLTGPQLPPLSLALPVVI